jgi:hypothetical protein
MGFVGQRLKKFIQHFDGIKLPAVKNLGRANPAAFVQFIEFLRGDSEVHRGLDAREAAARDRPDGGEGGGARHVTAEKAFDRVM